MMLSTHALQSMGFRPLQPGETIEAAFHSLHVFEVRGFTFKDGGVTSRKATASGVNYTLVVGGSVNEISRTILGDVYTEDEDAWAKEHKCTPPYVVVHFGPTRPHTVAQGYVKADDGTIVTYDAFGAARGELKALEAKALPSVEMALSCAFSQGTRDVQFKPVSQTIFGITPAKETIHDVRLTSSAHAYVSTQLTTAEIDSGLASAIELAESVDPRVSQFFQLGLRDGDSLKRFLYYFLAIEIEVHRVFRTVTRAQHITNGATLAPRLCMSLNRLIEHRDNWTNLSDRFVWCAVSVWKHLSDADIEEFKRLKKVRDGIAHGDVASPDAASVLAVEKLAKKIHLYS